MLLGSIQEAPQVQVRDGRVVIDVNWDDADSLRDHFRRHGLSGTVGLDPVSREASLELWDAPSLERARAVLEAWLR
jgi:hypothetical protein